MPHIAVVERGVSGAAAPSPSETAARFAALRSRDFRLLLAGQAVSLTGSQMQQVAVVWQLYLLTNSPFALGALGFFRMASILALALGGGVLADAVDRRKLMLASQIALALVSASLAVLAHLGRTTPAAIYGLVALGGAATAFDSPARQALVARLVPAQQLGRALSLYTAVWQVATIAGPAIGGAILAWAGATPIYVIDVLSFGAVIAALLAMEHRDPGRGMIGINFRAALEGIHFLRRMPVIWSTMLLDFVATFFAGSLLLLPIFADKLLHAGPRGLGFLYAAQPIGAALTGIALAASPPIRRQGAAVIGAVSVYGAAIALFGVSSAFWLSFALLAIAGAADTISMVVRQTLRHALTPDELRGRISSVVMIFFLGGPQLGEVEAGAVARFFGARFSVASGGLLCVISAALAALFLPALRRATDVDRRAPQDR